MSDKYNKKSNEPVLLGGAGDSANNEIGGKSVQKLLIVFIIGLLVGGGSVWMWFGGPADTDDISEGADEELKSDEMPANVLSFGSTVSDESGNAILVQNQPAGNSVSINSVVLSKIGWVAIHEDRDGAPGNILGATLFNAGRNIGVVDLLRPTAEGGTYYAMLHNESGRGENIFEFDYKKDLPILDSKGNPIMMKFKAE